MAGEQAAGVAVGAGAEQQEVEDGQAHAVAAGEAGDEGLFVLVGQLLGVVEIGGVDGVDGRGAELLGDLLEQLLLQEGVVGVFVVEGHGALVGEEDLPLTKVDGVFGAGGRGEQGLRQRLGEGTARDGDLEGTVTTQAGILCLDDVGSQSGRELADRWVGVEVWLLVAHGGVIFWQVKGGGGGVVGSEVVKNGRGEVGGSEQAA